MYAPEFVTGQSEILRRLFVAKNKSRIEWVDIAKAVAIICMIIGHVLPVGSNIRNLIFSFHMPLFFVCAGLFETDNISWENLKRRALRNVRKLIFPCIVTQFIGGCFRMIVYNENVLTIIKTEIMKFFWASAYENNGVYLGALWFLVVLYWSKLLFYVIQLIFPSKYNGIVYLFLALIGGMISKHVRLPQGGDIVLVASLFIYSGFLLSKAKNILEKYWNVVIFISFIFWIYWWENGIYIELGIRYYPKFVICIFEAVCGCLCIFALSKVLNNTIFSKMLAYIGQHTLLILCVHYLDWMINFLWYGKEIWRVCILRTVIDIIIALGIVKGYEKIVFRIRRRKDG